MNNTARKRKGVSFFIIIVSITVCLISGKLFFSAEPLSVGGYSLFIVGSSSMEPEYPVRSLVIIKNDPMDNLEIGDVIIFKSKALNGGLALHRIIRFTDDGIYTAGDNNRFEDNQLITKETYVGKEIYHNYSLGWYFTSIKTPVGFFAYFAFPIILLSLFIFIFKRLIIKRR